MWDLFCNVVDNYGDIGVTWRLARQLRNEFDLPVRLWVDDLGALHRLASAIDPESPVQTRLGIEIRLWRPDATPDVEPGAVVVEAFGCRLPSSFIASMARRAVPPVWLNLEYLSAEEWVAGCHRLASPHPHLPLTKYFFFPGFTLETGGLLRDRQLLSERDAFQREARGPLPDSFPAAPGELRVSLFSYENPALPLLLEAWGRGTERIRLLVPEGRAVAQLCAFLKLPQMAPGQTYRRNQLAVDVLPFTDQDGYDRLLWASDINFVRGEDSFVRAQWAARPFIWHIYPQLDRAHEPKLAAFLSRCEPPKTVKALFAAWNGVPGAPSIERAWDDAITERNEWNVWAREWANLLSGGPELAAELVKFASAQVKSRPFD